MPEAKKSFQKKLNDISTIIDENLSDDNSDLKEIELIENWLGLQLGKIRLQKLKNITGFSDEVYHKPGMQDFSSLDYQNIVFDNLPNMDVFLFDKNYQYIFSGGKEKEKFKKTNADYTGKTMFEVYDKASQRKLFPFYNKVLNGEETEGEVRLGNDVYYLVAVPVRNHEGKIAAGIIISQNVTSDKLLEESLIKSKEQAQKADRAKSLFIANISHEIRTPLNSVIGFTEQLQKTELNEEQVNYVDHINNASDHLLYLVNEIVFLFKLGMGKVHIEETAFSLTQFLEEIVEITEIQAEKKGLDFIFEKDPALPEAIVGDPFRLRQILMNLLVNAIKYTDDGNITLRCELEQETPKKIGIVFRVTDTGVGIRKKDQPYIFEVFEQGHNRIDKIRGGAGLGLGICRKLVEMFKGEIWVESKKNLGSTFTVILPFRKSDARLIKEKEKIYRLEDNLLSGSKILIADDDKYNRLLTEMILKNWKSTYKIVSDGKLALVELQKEKFDIVLLDIHMPKKDGVQVIKKLKSDKNNINFSTPVLSLTANALKSDLHRYHKAGFDGHIIKPFKEIELYNKICNILNPEDEKNSSNDTSHVRQEHTTFDVSQLSQIAGDDSRFFNEMIVEFIGNAQDLITSFNHSLKGNDWEIIGREAHKAIPSFRFFGIEKVAKLLGKIENFVLREGNYGNVPDLVKRSVEEIKKAIVEAEKFIR